MTDREKDFEEKVLAAGSWITEEFLEGLLSQHEKSDKIKVIEKSVTPAVGFGNNYMSMLHRVIVKFCENGSNSKEQHLIIKQFPSSQIGQKFVEELKLFEREISIYTEILPKINDIFRRFSNEPFLAPMAYPSPMENVLIMEDLKIKGYEMVNRQDQLPFDHCIEALKSLSQLHVLSIVLEKEYPGTLDKITCAFFSEKTRDTMEPFMKEYFPMISKLLEDIPELVKFSKVVNDFGAKGYDIVMNNFEKAKEDFVQVLGHGDMWLANIMFKKDENGQLVHSKLVDFQMCRKSSPAIDVLHLLFTSVQPQVLSEKWSELIESYYNAFLQYWKLYSLEEKCFTLDELHRELQRLSPHAFNMICSMLPHVINRTDDVIDMEAVNPDALEIPDDGHFIKQTFRREKTRNIMIQYFKHCDKLGYIDEIQKTMDNIQ